MRALRTFITVLRVLVIMRMCGMLVGIGGVRSVAMTLLTSGVLMMPERHALPHRDRGHALHRNG